MAAPLSRRILLSQNFYKLVKGTTLLNNVEISATSSIIQQRLKHSKHWNPKFRRERGAKFLEIDLPEYEEPSSVKNERKSPDERRMDFKKEGNTPPSAFNPKPITISCTSSVFEKFIPPEGDGKSSLLSTKGAKDNVVGIGKKTSSWRHMKKIKDYEETFSTKTFPVEAMDVYKEAHKLMEDLKKNEDRLHDLVTENAYPQLTFGLESKSLRWNFIESVEPPRVVHIRTTDMMSKENLYAQVTVRLHTKQTLAIYDRFGRLMYGSENLIKDVLEYVVYEKHVSDEYGRWRIHDKIIPDWMPHREPLHKTYIKPKFDYIPPPPEDETKALKKKFFKKPEKDSAPSEETTLSPALA